MQHTTRQSQRFSHNGSGSSSHFALRSGLFTAVLISSLIGTACGPTSSNQDSLEIGLLLPFTGKNSGESSSIERSVMLASEMINAAGGINGQPLGIEARDSHSDLKNGLAAADSLLAFRGVHALLGPNDDDLALQIIPKLRRSQVIGITGGTSAPSLSFAVDDQLWYRTTPATLTMANALAERMVADGVRRATVIYQSNESGTGWANVLTAKLTVYGAQSAGIFSFSPEQESFVDILHRAFSDDVDAVVLIANAGSAATIVNEWASLGHPGHWYLGPSLNNPVFIENISPNVLNGAIGIAPGLGDNAPAFAQRYAERWQNEQPLNSAYYFFDALMLWALAAQDQALNHPPYSASKVRNSLTLISGPAGQAVNWDEINQSYSLLSADVGIDYQGASGKVDMDERGDIRDASVAFWTIRDGQIVNEGASE